MGKLPASADTQTHTQLQQWQWRKENGQKNTRNAKRSPSSYSCDFPHVPPHRSFLFVSPSPPPHQHAVSERERGGDDESAYVQTHRPTHAQVHRHCQQLRGTQRGPHRRKKKERKRKEGEDATRKTVSLAPPLKKRNLKTCQHRRRVLESVRRSRRTHYPPALRHYRTIPFPFFTSVLTEQVGRPVLLPPSWHTFTRTGTGKHKTHAHARTRARVRLPPRRQGTPSMSLGLFLSCLVRLCFLSVLPLGKVCCRRDPLLRFAFCFTLPSPRAASAVQLPPFSFKLTQCTGLSRFPS